ncbi:hypothetical protein Tco_0031289 [Tanacetum coccineum]
MCKARRQQQNNILSHLTTPNLLQTPETESAYEVERTVLGSRIATGGRILSNFIYVCLSKSSLRAEPARGYVVGSLGLDKRGGVVEVGFERS